MNKKGTVLLAYCFKGGIGKSTMTGMSTFLLGRAGKKVLAIDFDPQSNLTSMLKETYHVESNAKKSFSQGLRDLNIGDCVLTLDNNVDMVEGDFELNDWLSKIANQNEQQRYHILNRVLEPLKHNYDYVLVDVPPTLNDIAKNAIYAADGITVILQTQKLAYDSTLQTVKTLIDIRQSHGAKFAFLGVLLYLVKKNTKINEMIITKAKRTFTGNLYKNKITYQERVNIFSAEGIKNEDHWDRRAIHQYQVVTDEMLDRVKGMIK